MNNKTVCAVCGSENDCCVSTDNERHSTFLCYNCGYTANDAITIDSPETAQLEANMSDFVRDMKFYDRDRDIYWYLAIVQTDLGVVLPQSDGEDWHWAAAKMTEIPDEEATKFPVPNKPGEFYKYRIDLENAEQFNKSQFKKACNVILEDIVQK